MFLLIIKVQFNNYLNYSCFRKPFLHPRVYLSRISVTSKNQLTIRNLFYVLMR